ncbi:hypothetical protein KTC96_02525 [Clostridium estertheticum]|uniref:hypothetical protein n=1 Tax=Clostridium estertheticum TaxID=238834 RepID=UPI001C7CF684|nr:hypothetical protein [Clostridium estertheticum]MBX4261571.1 hypothetical protein [Clostridium estertheticum]WLC70929.1 hypothetical protein KTC96_02525 [Clostridium estertheticum]
MSDTYRNKVRTYLEKFSSDLSDGLMKLSNFNFHPEIEVLDFVIFNEGFTSEFSIRMFCMTRDANEFSHDIKNDGDTYFSGGYDLLQQIEHIFSYDELEYYEKLGIDFYKEDSIELIKWFSEIWNKIIAGKINIPSYLCLHDDMRSFDLINLRWILDDEKWRKR